MLRGCDGDREGGHQRFLTVAQWVLKMHDEGWLSYVMGLTADFTCPECQTKGPHWTLEATRKREPGPIMRHVVTCQVCQRRAEWLQEQAEISSDPVTAYATTVAHLHRIFSAPEGRGASDHWGLVSL